MEPQGSSAPPESGPAQPETGSAEDRAHDRALARRVGRELASRYGTVVEEPLPDEIAALLRRLDEVENSSTRFGSRVTLLSVRLDVKRPGFEGEHHEALFRIASRILDTVELKVWMSGSFTRAEVMNLATSALAAQFGDLVTAALIDVELPEGGVATERA